jgi:hypothetical protein
MRQKFQIHLYNTFECLWFKCVLALKIMNFEYVSSTKSYSLLCGRAWMHNICDIGWRCNINLFKYITQL